MKAHDQTPEELRSLVPHITVPSVTKAAEYYNELFGATVCIEVKNAKTNKFVHVELSIGSSIIMLTDDVDSSTSSHGASQPNNVALAIYIEDIDQLVTKAKSLGSRVVLEPTDAFWGDRVARIIDPMEVSWILAEKKRRIPCQEMSNIVIPLGSTNKSLRANFLGGESPKRIAIDA